jgi:hypothetical protein
MVLEELHIGCIKNTLFAAKVEKIRESARKLDVRGSTFKTGLEVSLLSLVALIFTS